MFHIREILLIKFYLVILIILEISFRIHSFNDDIFQTRGKNNNENKPENNHLIHESLFDKDLLSKLKKISHNLLTKNRIIDEKRFSTKKSKEHNKEVKENILEIKLLVDNELQIGEISPSSQKESADTVIKYDNGMFGLVDQEPTLHVWRAPFLSLGQIWPHPWSVTSTNNVFTICMSPSSLSFKLTGVDNYIIQHAINRYRRIICDKVVSTYPSNWRQQEHLLDNVISGQKIYKRTEQYRGQFIDPSHHLSAILKGEVRYINIFVETNGHQWPSLFMNESYRLSVNSNGIFIDARETWGVLRALESVSQLVWRTRAGRVFINETKIIDQPRFKHRGLQLDTARHFIPKDIILKNLDAMSMNKFNVFHWHISDDQSFPLVTDNHPEFALYGSYDFETKTYRPDDVKEILEYARLRGIRVIPEIDSPSHSLSWRKSHPEVMTRCIDQNRKWSGQYGPVNMAAASTYRLLKSLFTDIVHLFPDQWIHLGSDEVATGCVLKNPAIQTWMQSVGISSIELLTDFYTRKLQNIITEIGHNHTNLQRGYIVWQEAYERNSLLKKGTIVQLWKSQSTSEAASLARQKIFVIYSACWYLDRLEYGAQWMNNYNCDPAEDYGSMMNSDVNWVDYILGGEAAMWTEFFDADNVLQRIWPLACAASERLWSPRRINNIAKAAPRLEEMRCRMLTRSIPVGVASGAGDCGQRTENIANAISHYHSSDKSAVFLSDASSLRLLYQLFSNLLNRKVFVFILFMAAALCIYLRRQLRLPNSRVMLPVIVVLGIYTLFWIFSQHLLLSN